MFDLIESIRRVASETRFAGMVRIDDDDDTPVSESFGLMHRGFGLPNTVDTQFAIASGGKGFTALAVVSLISDGTLSQLEKLSQVLEAAVFAVPHPILGEEVGAALRVSGPLTLSELWTLLDGHLSRYQMPRQLLIVDDLPRGATGRVDKSALLASIQKRDLDAVLDTEYRGTTEERVAAIWREALGKPIDRTAPYAASGGDSLRAVRIMLAVREEFEIEFDMRDLDESGSIADMAIQIRRKATP